MFDSNNDGRISEIDLFKLFACFDKGGAQEVFEVAFQRDLMVIVRHMQAKKEQKEHRERMQESLRGYYFRN